MEPDWPNVHDVFRLVFDAAPNGIVVAGPGGKIVLVNETAAKMFGYGRAELLALCVEDLVPQRFRKPHQDLRRKYDRTPHHRAMGVGRDLFAQRKDGSEFPVEIGLTPVETPDGMLVVSCVVDITERKRAEEKVKKLEEQILHASEREQRRIGRDIHDDLCQQLASIGCLAKVLEQQLGEIYGEGAQSLAQIGEMVSQVNVRAREIAHGLVPATLESDGLVGALQDLAARTHRAYPVDCRFECTEPVSEVGGKESIQLFRIAQEAINNSVKHAAPTSICIQLSGCEDNLRLVVSDDGSGMEKPREPGSGLGLLTMAHRARTLGGEFNIHTGANQGTTIECIVPTLPPTDRAT